MFNNVPEIRLLSYPSRPASSPRTPAPSPDLPPTDILEDLAMPLLLADLADHGIDDLDSSPEGIELGSFSSRKKRNQMSLRDRVETRLSLIGEWVLFILYYLIPSFLQDLIERKQNKSYSNSTGASSTCPRHLTTPRLAVLLPSPSSQTLRALNGVRGVACLVVFNFHFLYPYTRTITHGFLSGTDMTNRNGDDNSRSSNNKNTNLHQLPFICLSHRGRAAVCVFFALSGYVLSYRFLQLIRSQRWEQAQRTLSSLAVRRALRLYIPPTITITTVALAAWFHAFESGAKLFGSIWTVGGEWEPHPSRHESFRETWHAFIETWWSWSNPFTWNPLYIEYDPHLWTIPIEFRGSMVLFLTLLAMARLRALWRCLLTTWLGVYCMMYGRWDMAVFLGGAVVAEIHLVISKLSEENTTSHLPRMSRSNHSSTNRSAFIEILTSYATTPSRYWKPYIYLLLIISLYLLSFPDSSPESTPGFSTLAGVTIPSLHHAKYLFWHSIGSILFVFSIELLPLIQHIFETSIPQYLGQISYALYLVHGPLQHSLAFALQPKVWKGMMGLPSAEGDGHVLPVKPANYDTLWCVGLLVNWVFTLMVTIAMADLFWRLVDKSCVTLARRIEGLISLSNVGNREGSESHRR